MDIKELKNTMPYQWRIQSWNKDKTSASCVAYFDARDVATMLDNVCGPENWQDEYKIVGTLLFAGIGIKIGADWIWKWDTGSESNIEKEKGHVSDSFKRAGVKWGIGRFLYDLPIQRVKGNGNGRVLDESGKEVWDVTEYINNRTRKPPKASAQQKVEPKPEPTIKEYNALLADAAKQKGVEFVEYKAITDIPPALYNWAKTFLTAQRAA